MFFIILVLLLTVGYTFLLNIIPLSNWFLFLWIPLAFILAVASVFAFILIFIFTCPKNNPKGKFRHFILKQGLFLAVKWNHLDITVVGLENIDKNETYVIYGNHKSMMDPIIMYMNMGIICTAIGKSELFQNKLMIALKDTFGAVSLNRNNTREAVKSINEGIEKLKGGLSVIIFPEGGILTREEEKMSGLRAGAYKLALKSQRSILPITLIGTSQIAKLPRRQKKEIKLIIHRPFKYDEFANMNTVEIGQMVENLVNGDISEAKN